MKVRMTEYALRKGGRLKVTPDEVEAATRLLVPNPDFDGQMIGYAGGIKIVGVPRDDSFLIVTVYRD